MRHEPSAVDDHDLVRELRDLREDMARDEDRAAARRERAQEVAQPADPLRVEPVRRLVEHEQLRQAEQRARDAQALPHAERVPAHLPPGGAAQLHLGEHLVHARQRNPAGQGEHPEMVSPRPRRMEAVGLEHGADPSQRVAQAPVRLARDPRLARGRPDEPEHRAQRRRLAGAVRPEEAGDAPGRNREGQIVDRDRRAVPLRQPPHLDRRRFGHQPASRSTSRYTLRGWATCSISRGPATSVP